MQQRSLLVIVKYWSYVIESVQITNSFPMYVSSSNNRNECIGIQWTSQFSNNVAFIVLLFSASCKRFNDEVQFSNYWQSISIVYQKR